jgi:hypothetical protein
MGDERIERRTPLGFIESRHRFAVAGIGAEAVDRLGRKCHETALPQHAHGGCDREIAGRHDLRRALRSHGRVPDVISLVALLG